MKKRIVFELAAGILILVSALYTYVPKSQYMHELTFISNMVGAGLLLSDATYAVVKRKWLPSVLFLIAGGCTVSGLAHFNYSGGMFFLHVVNPIVFMGFYLLVEAKRKFNVAEIAWSPIFVLLYLLFDYIRFRFVGSFVYGLFPTEKMSLLNAMVIGIIMYILVGTWGLLICSVGRLVKNITD